VGAAASGRGEPCSVLRHPDAQPERSSARAGKRPVNAARAALTAQSKRFSEEVSDEFSGPLHRSQPNLSASDDAFARRRSTAAEDCKAMANADHRRLDPTSIPAFGGSCSRTVCSASSRGWSWSSPTGESSERLGLSRHRMWCRAPCRPALIGFESKSRTGPDTFAVALVVVGCSRSRRCISPIGRRPSRLLPGHDGDSQQLRSLYGAVTLPLPASRCGFAYLSASPRRHDLTGRSQKRPEQAICVR